MQFSLGNMLRQAEKIPLEIGRKFGTIQIHFEKRSHLSEQ
jgi:hypothetical protein